MSVHVSSVAWRTKLPTVPKMLLLYYADKASQNGEGIWPSNTTAADALGVDEKTIRRAQATLRRTGILVQVQKALQHRPALWKIDTVELSRQAEDTPEKGATVAAISPYQDVQGGHRVQSGAASRVDSESARVDSLSLQGGHRVQRTVSKRPEPVVRTTNEENGNNGGDPEPPRTENGNGTKVPDSWADTGSFGKTL